MQAVFHDKLVEEIGGNHNGAGDGNVHPVVFLGQGILLDQAVQEGEAAGFSAKGTVAQPREPDMGAIGLVAEVGNDATPGIMMEGVNLLIEETAGFRRLRVMLGAETVRQGEQTAGKEPFREFVARGIGNQHIVGNVADNLLQLLQVGRSAAFVALGVAEDEIAEAEFILDIVGQLDKERTGILPQETHAQFVRDALDTRLRRL